MTSYRKRPSGPALRLQAARGCKPATPTKATSDVVAMPNIQRLLPLPTKDLDCVYALHKFDRLANRGDLADSPPKIRKRQCTGEISAGDEKFFAAQAADLKRCRTAIVLVPRQTDLPPPPPPPQLQQSDVSSSSGAATAAAMCTSAAGSAAAGSGMKPSVACRSQPENRELAAAPPVGLGCSASFPESASASPASSTAASGCDEDRLSSASCGESGSGDGGSGGSCCSSPGEAAGSLLLLTCGRDSVVSLSSASREPGDSNSSCSSFGSGGGGGGGGGVSVSSDVAINDGVALSSSAPLLPIGRGQSSACHWQGCVEVVGEAALLRHLQETHLQRQSTRRRLSHSQPLAPSSPVLAASSSSSSAYDPPSTAPVSCQWLGCKVFGRESRSRAWLEGHVLAKHVPGSKLFCCIVAGCDRRFGSQQLLARHVTTHFDDRPPTPATATAPGVAAAAHPRTRPNCEAGGSGAATPKPKKQRKMLKGLQPCIRKTEDFIDPSMFNHMQEMLYDLGDFWEQFFTPERDGVSFASEVTGQRTDADGRKQLLLHWYPPGVLDDCWIAEEERDEHRTRTVSVDRLQRMLRQSADFSPAVHGHRKSSATRCIR